MPVPPAAIHSLKGYAVGNWYPFSQKGGGIADPKTACVVGAAVWLFSGEFRNLDALTLHKEQGRDLPVSRAVLRLRTLVSDKYWLDSGCFFV